MDKPLEFHRRHAAGRAATNAEMIEELFVGGGWLERVASGKTFEVTNLANGATIAVLPVRPS